MSQGAEAFQLEYPEDMKPEDEETALLLLLRTLVKRSDKPVEVMFLLLPYAKAITDYEAEVAKAVTTASKSTFGPHRLAEEFTSPGGDSPIN